MIKKISLPNSGLNLIFIHISIDMVNTVFIVCCVAGHKLPIVVLSNKEIIQCCHFCSRSVQNADCGLQTGYKMQTTIIDKSRWDTPRKRPVSSNFDISTPFPLFNVVARSKCPRSVLQHRKGGEGVLAIDKKDAFWNYGRTPIESVCFAQMCQHFCPWLSEIAFQRK